MTPRRSRKDAVTPVGGGEALPPRPARTVVTDADLAQASDLWDEEMPEFDGLLDAEQVK